MPFPRISFSQHHSSSVVLFVAVFFVVFDHQHILWRYLNCRLEHRHGSDALKQEMARNDETTSAELMSWQKNTTRWCLQAVSSPLCRVAMRWIFTICVPASVYERHSALRKIIVVLAIKRWWNQFSIRVSFDINFFCFRCALACWVSHEQIEKVDGKFEMSRNKK